MNRVSATTELHLSQREKSIARLVAWGFTQKEIADRLFVSPLTISAHLRNIYSKLAIHKETDLCRWWIFYEYGIADNPLKRIIAVFLLLLSITSIVADNNMVRVFKSAPVPGTARVVKTQRTRKYEDVFILHFALTA